MSEFDYGTGRRKNATARTRLYAGNGAIEVNGRKVEDYFPRKTLQMIIRQPLVLTKLVDKFDVKVNVCGGGVTGQAEAVRHGISRALLSADPSLRGVLKRAGFLTRDARFRFVQAGGNPGLLAFISACVRWLLWEGLRFIIR